MIRTRRSLKGARKAPTRTRVLAQPSKSPEATFVSTGDPKRDLILMHLDARTQNQVHPHVRVGVGVAVVVAFCLVFFGWWVTFGLSIQAPESQQGEGLFDTVRNGASTLQDRARSQTEEIRQRLQTYGQ